MYLEGVQMTESFDWFESIVCMTFTDAFVITIIMRFDKWALYSEKLLTRK